MVMCVWWELACPSGFAPPHMASADGDEKCLLYLKLFPFSWKQLVLLASSIFSSTSPNEKFPLLRVHLNCIACMVLKLSAAVGPRNMLFFLSLLSWLGSFSSSFPAMNNVHFTLGAWQSSPLLTYGLGCLSPIVSHVSALARAHCLGRKFTISSRRPNFCSPLLHRELMECSRRTLALSTLEPNFVHNNLFLSVSHNSLLYLVIQTANHCAKCFRSKGVIDVCTLFPWLM